MCHTVKGYILALVAAFFASLFIAALVAGYTVQTAGYINHAIVDYFVAFLLLGIAKYILWIAMHEESPKKSKRRITNRRRR